MLRRLNHKSNFSLFFVTLSVISLALFQQVQAQPTAPELPLGINLQANVSIEIAPEENGKLVYAHIAPSSQEKPDGTKLSPILSIRNNSRSVVTLNKAMVEFLGPPFAIPIIFDVNVDINPGEKQSIHLQNHPDFVNDEGGYQTYTIRLPFPAPPAVNFILHFQNFPQPTEVFRQLAKHMVDTPTGDYRFPGKKSDLAPGQFWSGKSNWTTEKIHKNHERFAFDIGVREWDSNDGAWRRVKPGTTKCQNENWLIWDKPIYAIAHGVVEKVTDGNQDRQPTLDSCVGTGSEGLNSIHVRYGDEVVRYLHLKQGTAVVAVGDVVQIGDKLANVGNSGKTSNPHLHIDVRKDNQLRPLQFGCTLVIDRKIPDPAGIASAPWVELKEQALPWEDSLIWPSPNAGFAEIARHGIKASAYQNIFTNITACNYMPFWVDGYDVNGQNFFNVVFRPANVPWQARHGLTSGEYQTEIDKWKAEGYRPIQVESYRQGNRIRYAAIFVKKSGSLWVAYHGKTPVEHQAEFDQLTEKGFHPVNISVVSIHGNRRYTALYEKSNVGSWQAKSFLTPGEYQQAFDENKSAGRQLAYVQAYNHNGDVRFSGIWYSVFSTMSAAQHGMNNEEYQKKWEELTGKGHQTQIVTGYAQNNEMRFTALWRKPN